MLDGVVVNYVFESRKRLNSSSQTFLFKSVFSVSMSLCLDYSVLSSYFRGLSNQRNHRAADHPRPAATRVLISVIYEVDVNKKALSRKHVSCQSKVGSTSIIIPVATI